MCIENYIPAKIIELCAKTGITKYRLSQTTGISQSALSDITKGKNLPGVITLEKICDAFGITLAQFFTEDGNVLDLSEEQKRLLQTWSTLKPEDRLIGEELYQYLYGEFEGKVISGMKGCGYSYLPCINLKSLFSLLYCVLWQGIFNRIPGAVL